MQIEGIGIDFCGLGFFNRLDQVGTNLQRLHDMGFRVVEIALEQQNFIIDGKIRRQEFENFKSILRQFDLRYTIHGYMRLNLAYDERRDLCRQIMAAQIEFCREIGATRLVIHSGLEALTTPRQGMRRTLLSNEELAEGARQEVLALKEAALQAEDAGVVICVENGDAHLWELNVLAQYGAPASDLAKHHPRLKIGPIIRQLEAVNHPNVGMTLDFGHLHIAANTLGFDYLAAIREASPWIRHLHLSDNFGRLDRGVNNEWERWAFGEADIHMPPGWGCIPYDEVFKCIPDFRGYAILEINDNFQDYFKQALETTKKWLGC
jgi:sugar phosphate isomerase/epimerase